VREQNERTTQGPTLRDTLLCVAHSLLRTGVKTEKGSPGQEVPFLELLLQLSMAARRKIPAQSFVCGRKGILLGTPGWNGRGFKFEILQTTQWEPCKQASPFWEPLREKKPVTCRRGGEPGP
jgi:hypothetical protein